MSLKRDIRYKIKTLPSGKRVRVAMIGDRVIETRPMPPRRTKSRTRLSRTRRKIGLQ